MSKINLGFLELDLNEFVKVIKDLTSGQLDNESKAAITEMIVEVRKTYETILDSLMPFYTIVDDDAIYRDRFSSQFVEFKKIYLTKTGDLRTHCHKIQIQLNKLLNKRNWLRRVPMVRESLENLKNLTNKWIGREDDLAYHLERFLSTVNDNLTKIDELRQANMTESRIALSSFVKESEPELKNIKSQLDELDIISAKL